MARRAKKIKQIMTKDTDLHIRLETKARLKALADRLNTTITKIVTPPIEREVKRLEKEVNKMEKKNDN